MIATVFTVVSGLFLGVMTAVAISRAPAYIIPYIGMYGSIGFGLVVWYFISTALGLSGVAEIILTMSATVLLFLLIGAEIVWRYTFGESFIRNT